MKIKTLSVIAIFFVLIIIWIGFFEQYYIQTIIPNKSSEINMLLKAICISYITSFGFYYIVVYLKEKRDRKIIIPFIANHTYFLINEIRFLILELRIEAGLISKKLNLENKLFAPDDYLLENEWSYIIAINPNTWKTLDERKIIDGFMRIPTFLGKINKSISSVDYNINKILSLMQFVTPEYIRILTDIQENKFHKLILSRGNYRTEEIKIPYNNFEMISDSMKEYFELIKVLEVYSDKNLKKFIDNKHLLKK